MASKAEKGKEPEKDFYKILGVEKTASESQIKNAYRKLAMKFHPDKNPGDLEAAEKFKEISIAYAVLIDPNKRRQYDVSGPSGALVDFEGVDPSELGSVGRVFGALFSKLGVPIPTQISPKVLALARELTENKPTEAKAFVMTPGQVVSERVEKQEPFFFKFTVTPNYADSGVFVICRSPSMSKFKLILFDKEGGVRQIEESFAKKRFTSAEMYFVPFDRANLSELFPMKFFAEDKEVPLQFHLLDGLEPSSNVRLEQREHLGCVYGDNWFKDVKFNLQILPAAQNHQSISTIVETEQQLLAKKAAMALFQPEFIEAKKRFEAAVTRLETESKEIVDLLKIRESTYEEFIQASTTPYSANMEALNQQTASKGIFSGFFG